MFGTFVSETRNCECLVGNPYIENGICRCTDEKGNKPTARSRTPVCNCFTYPCNCDGKIIDRVPKNLATVGSQYRELQAQAIAGISQGTQANFWVDNKPMLIGLGIAVVAGYFLLKD